MREFLKQGQKEMEIKRMIAEQELTKYVRLTDTYTQFDTLLLDPNFLISPSKFFEIMDTVAGTKLFKFPIDSKYDN